MRALTHISLEMIWNEINAPKDGAPKATVEALMLGLRARGIKALEEPAIRRRLSELSDDQVIEVGNRLQRLKPVAPAWSAAEVQVLFGARIGK
jgi:hypothetical protein